MNEKKYSDDNIQVLEGLDAVKKRPGMYIGSTDERGLHHLIWEIVDNGIDEILGGFGDKMNITINEDGSLSVEDFGRGIPTGKNKQSGLSTPEVVFTILHAGGKFGGDSAYKTSGGLHGVGSSVVNALSEWMEVEIVRDGEIHKITFKEGKVIKKLQKTASHGGTKNKKSGTMVTFKPNKEIFSTTNFDFKTVRKRLQESSFLLENIEINIEDKRKGKEKKESFKYKNGLSSYISELRKEKKELSPIFSYKGIEDKIEVEFALQYTNSSSELVASFVNNVRTTDGGTHENGFRTGLTKAVNTYARSIGVLKEKEENLGGNDIREGLIAIISIRIPEDILQFEGQTKAKLGTSEARAALDQIVSTKMGFALNENPETSKKILEKALLAREAREAARKAREAVKGLKKRKGKELNTSKKLAPAQVKNPDINELFLCEGDSASGSAKEGRERLFQAILPLRGKTLNAETAQMKDILANEEYATLIYTINAGVGEEFDVKKSNYDKIIIMTDADTDGAHIRTLLITFFYRYMRGLVEAGKLYVALPPLYKVYKMVGKKELFKYVWEEEELENAKIEIGEGFLIQRYKGLGEMNPDQLSDTTMNPQNRVLQRVTVLDEGKADKTITTLMGKDAEKRREWISENVDFTMKETFEK